MKLLFLLTIGLAFIYDFLCSAVKVGDFAQVLNMVEKVFVDTAGTARKIWKGGVVVREDTGDGLCLITIRELRETRTELVTYAVVCTRLLPSDFQCPSAAPVSYKCQQPDLSCISESLYQNGFVVINGPVAGFPGSALANSFAEEKYLEMIRIARKASLDPHSLDFHFSDVSSRGPGRWEMKVMPEDLVDSNSMFWLTNMWDQAQANVILPALSGAVNRARRANSTEDATKLDIDIEDVSTPIFKAVFDGVLISTPGADTQHWHRDSGLHTLDISHYTVYIPTAEVTLAMGPTEFLPGTNRDFTFKFDDWANYFDYCATTVRPLLSAGSMLIWDYRVVHRGTRNINYSSHNRNSEEIEIAPNSASSLTDGLVSAREEINRNRPMLYRTYHLEGSWQDINMGDTSFYALRETL